MKKVLSIIITVLALLSCSQTGEHKSINIKGTWTLDSIVYPYDMKYVYPDNDISWLRIYDDSCYYQCQVTKAPTGNMFIPNETGIYTLIEHDKGEYLYLHEDGKHPFSIESDSTIMIQQDGRQFYWKVCHDFDEDKINTIIGVVRHDLNNLDNSANRYVFSYAEKKLETINHTLIYTFIFIAFAVMIILNRYHNLSKNKKRIEQELRLIEQERQSIPEPVREAMNIVEEDFHNSIFYTSLHERIDKGEHLTEEDWTSINEKINSVYPHFISSLLNLYEMSQTELQVCTLIKLNLTPSQIANVLCREKSTISSIRSRLYSKVFGGKGGTKEWDDFIHSL